MEDIYYDITPILGSSAGYCEKRTHDRFTLGLRLPDVLEGQGLSLNLLSKLVLPLILEKHLVVLEYFPVSLKILEYFSNFSFLNY